MYRRDKVPKSRSRSQCPLVCNVARDIKQRAWLLSLVVGSEEGEKSTWIEALQFLGSAGDYVSVSSCRIPATCGGVSLLGVKKWGAALGWITHDIRNVCAELEYWYGKGQAAGTVLMGE